MKKKWLWIGSILVAVLFVAALYVIIVPPKPSTTPRPEDTAGNTKKACEVFTDAIAREILGAKAQKSDAVSTDNQSSTENVYVSSCGYQASTTIANVLVRAAKRSEAYSTNIFGFESVRNQAIDKKPKTVPIKNLGDEAFYNPEFQEVNVLIKSGQYWLIVKVGKDKALAEKVARAVVKNL